MQHHHNGTFIIKSSQKPMKNGEVNPPPTQINNVTFNPPNGQVMVIFVLKLSGCHVVS